MARDELPRASTDPATRTILHIPSSAIPKDEVWAWIRASVLNMDDEQHLIEAQMLGWKPVAPEKYRHGGTGGWANEMLQQKTTIIRIGGLILCWMPMEKWEQLQAEKRNTRAGQLNAIRFMFPDGYRPDSRMPMVVDENETVFEGGRTFKQ